MGRVWSFQRETLKFILKCWYRHTSARAPNPYWTNMEKVRGDFQTIYEREEPHPPGTPLETHMDPVQVNNATHVDAEVETEVSRLLFFKERGHTYLRAEHFK